jgi:hypothetical protein
MLAAFSQRASKVCEPFKAIEHGGKVENKLVLGDFCAVLFVLVIDE